MSNKYLLQNENNFVTDIGKAFVGERAVVRGLDLHKDLKYCSWFEIFLYTATGKRFSEKELKLLNCIWGYTGYPDPRLWNNRVSALAGAARSTKSAGVSAAIAISEATVFGTRVCVRCIDLLQRAQKAVEGGEKLRSFLRGEMRRYRVLYGYGRPVNNAVDERIPPTISLMEELGIEQGTYVKLCFEIEKNLPGQRMNMVGLASAIAADLGMTADQYHSFIMFCFTAGMFPVYDAARDVPTGSFLPLRCETINYSGSAKRKWSEGDTEIKIPVARTNI